ncbi:uncharacterized protein [Macrobrachium rosenbergii]|uniref:uncharacterized protein n=1 Tax=Macrobrachium rosenbergii TaxID=79674 RepID=UPI0034D5A7F7
MLYVLLWTLAAILPRALSSRLYPSEDADILTLSRAPIISLLEDSSVPSCSLIFITDGSTSPSTVTEIMRNVSDKYFPSYVEIKGQADINSTLFNMQSAVEKAVEIKRSSACLTVVVVSNDPKFLLTTIKISVGSDLLTQPTRLIILTKVLPADLHPVHEDLSSMDAVVVLFESLPTTLRCRTFVYIPYSLRKVQTASWVPEKGLVYVGNKNPFPNKFSRMMDGAHVKAAIRNFLPHVILTETKAENGELEYSITGPVDDVVRLLAKQEADLALGPLAITYARSRVVVFTVPLIIDYLIIQGRRGGTEVDPWSFALPFTLSVWIYFLITFCIAVVTAFAIRRIKWSWAGPSGGTAGKIFGWSADAELFLTGRSEKWVADLIKVQIKEKSS